MDVMKYKDEVAEMKMTNKYNEYNIVIARGCKTCDVHAGGIAIAIQCSPLNSNLDIRYKDLN